MYSSTKPCMIMLAAYITNFTFSSVHKIFTYKIILLIMTVIDFILPYFNESVFLSCLT